MDVYKAKIQYGGSIEKPKLRIVVKGDMQNMELVRDTWSPTSHMKTLKISWQIQLKKNQEFTISFYWSILESQKRRTEYL